MKINLIEIDGKRVEVAEKDFPETMDWSKANKAISVLGEGWRFPTIKELKEIYKESEFCRKNFNFNFVSHSYYWAGNSVVDNESEEKAALYFSPYEPDSAAGYYRDFDKSGIYDEGFRVRAVRDL